VHAVRAPQRRRSVVARPPVADPEVHAAQTASVVWLNRPLLDPTPPAARLQRSFARGMWITSRAAGADWALVLGILRAQGLEGRVPTTLANVRTVADQLAGLRKDDKSTEWSAAAALLGDVTSADRAVALAHFNRAVGVETLVQGLEGAKKRLVKRTLADPRIAIYEAGRDDLKANRVDVRVVVTIRYLTDTFGSVAVSSLISGHRLYARAHVVSAHIYGEAVDIAAVGGTPIYGNQEAGGPTEQAVRALLLLPGDLEPKQVISLIGGLGGPSFALLDHDDHIHVGF
jgi:hypothetical protein